ncbi:hypothetical protein B0H14DRAFT_3489802 [Mycena olivaceomarginata]|nr:hypothetical protein B0H14DRAFT_3489802 [Mycena olivaceomarginata]
MSMGITENATTESGSSPTATSPSGGSTSSIESASGFTPNGKKAGTSSGNAYSILESHIGWWYDWSPNPTSTGSPIPRPHALGITSAPQYMLGFEEPDCASGGGSAGMSVAEGMQIWEQYIAPFKEKGTKLGSPSMCKQAAETWLNQFSQQISTDWDFTTVHVNKNNMIGVKADLDHYASYDKPLWVTEFACVDDVNGFTPCTDQEEINDYINQIVDLFQTDSRVAAYAYR